MHSLTLVIALVVILGHLPTAVPAQEGGVDRVYGSITNSAGVRGEITVYLVQPDSGATWRTTPNQTQTGEFEFKFTAAASCADEAEDQRRIQCLPPGLLYHLSVVSAGRRLYIDSKTLGDGPFEWPAVLLRLDEVSELVAVTTLAAERDSPERDSVIIHRVDSIVKYRVDSIVRNREDSARWRLGVGAGVASVFTFNGWSFWAPAVSVFGERANRWYVRLLGGWKWWKGPFGDDPLTPLEPRPQFRDRAETIAALAVSRFFSDTSGAPGLWGLSAGVEGAWETVREQDEFLKRAYGVTLGGRFRLGRHKRYNLMLGFDLKLANVSEFQITGSRWRFGVAPSVTFDYRLR